MTSRSSIPAPATAAIRCSITPTFTSPDAMTVPRLVSRHRVVAGGHLRIGLCRCGETRCPCRTRPATMSCARCRRHAVRCRRSMISRARVVRVLMAGNISVCRSKETARRTDAISRSARRREALPVMLPATAETAAACAPGRLLEGVTKRQQARFRPGRSDEGEADRQARAHSPSAR